MIGRFSYFFIQFNSPNPYPFINQELEKPVFVSNFASPYRSLYRAPLFSTVVITILRKKGCKRNDLAGAPNENIV